MKRLRYLCGPYHHHLEDEYNGLRKSKTFYKMRDKRFFNVYQLNDFDPCGCVRVEEHKYNIIYYNGEPMQNKRGDYIYLHESKQPQDVKYLVKLSRKYDYERKKNSYDNSKYRRIKI